MEGEGMSSNYMEIKTITYDNNNRYFFYDIQSGFFVESRAILNKIIGLYPEHSPEEILDLLKEEYPEELIKKSFEYIKNMYKSNGMLSQKNKVIQKNSPPKLKNLWLNIVHDCNMRCIYCFANGGDYKDERMNMSVERAKKCIDYWYKNLGDFDKVNVYFFGGEPFLNRKVIEYSMEYIDNLIKSTGRKVCYNITTNGTIFDEDFVKKLKEHDVELLFSVDGTPDIHDSQRIFASGRGTYNVISENLKKFQEYFPRLNANIVVTKKSAPYFQKSVEHLFKMGFKNVTFFLSITSDDGLAFTEEDLDIIFSQIKHLNTLTLKNIIHHKSGILVNALAICKKIHLNLPYSGCALENNSVSVFTPDGTMFKCYELLSEKEFSIGHIDTADKWENMCKNKNFMKSLDERVCNKCWAQKLCGGGCAYDSFVYNKDVNIPYSISCKLVKFLISEGIRMYSELYMSIPESLDRLFKNTEI